MALSTPHLPSPHSTHSTTSSLSTLFSAPPSQPTNEVTPFLFIAVAVPPSSGTY